MLKLSYFRVLGQRLFSEKQDCFTAGGVINYRTAGKYESVGDFVRMIPEYTRTNTAVGVYKGCNSEFSIDHDHATGYWLCTYHSVDTVAVLSHSQGRAYCDEYQRIDDE